MEHVKALAIKALMTLVVLYLILGLGFEMSFGNVVLITLVLGVLSYLLGDLYILPKTSNMTATMADLGMAFLVIWLLGMALTDISAGTMAGAAILSAIVMAVGEYFFHKFMLKRDFTPGNRYRTSNQY
ncbi:YndM family protein [Gracilibacillus xinjiangensis]|uniref:YndM family protein n=1 Tax=Gracilibacillus xinjiangensis TaxID=1193282 RepID=A0ABV8WR97_9BACI